jgi:hypothetical protein
LYEFTFKNNALAQQRNFNKRVKTSRSSVYSAVANKSIDSVNKIRKYKRAVSVLTALSSNLTGTHKEGLN